jgi:hypothetical protein
VLEPVKSEEAWPIRPRPVPRTIKAWYEYGMKILDNGIFTISKTNKPNYKLSNKID